MDSSIQRSHRQDLIAPKFFKKVFERIYPSCVDAYRHYNIEFLYQRREKYEIALLYDDVGTGKIDCNKLLSRIEFRIGIQDTLDIPKTIVFILRE